MEENEKNTHQQKDKIKKMMEITMCIALVLVFVFIEVGGKAVWNACLISYTIVVIFVGLPVLQLYRENEINKLSKPQTMFMMIQCMVTAICIWMIKRIMDSSFDELYWTYWIIFIAIILLAFMQGFQKYSRRKSIRKSGEEKWMSSGRITLMIFQMVIIAMYIQGNYSPPYHTTLIHLKTPNSIKISWIDTSEKVQSKVVSNRYGSKRSEIGAIEDKRKIEMLIGELEGQEVHNLRFIDGLNRIRARALGVYYWELNPSYGDGYTSIRLKDGNIWMIEIYSNGHCYLRAFAEGKYLIDTFEVKLSKETIELLTVK